MAEQRREIELQTLEVGLGGEQGEFLGFMSVVVKCVSYRTFVLILAETPRPYPVFLRFARVSSSGRLRHKPFWRAGDGHRKSS